MNNPHRYSETEVAAVYRAMRDRPGGKPVAILCLGHVAVFYPRPMLKQEGWKQGRPLHEFLFENAWGNTSVLSNVENNHDGQ
jgi:hypothetical protein